MERAENMIDRIRISDEMSVIIRLAALPSRMHPLTRSLRSPERGRIDPKVGNVEDGRKTVTFETSSRSSPAAVSVVVASDADVGKLNLRSSMKYRTFDSPDDVEHLTLSYVSVPICCQILTGFRVVPCLLLLAALAAGSTYE